MILLDTCAILWDALAPGQLTRKATSAIANAHAQKSLLLADISLWEIAMLIQKKRVTLDVSPAQFLNLYLQARNVRVMPITPEVAALATSLGAGLSNDPADRLIAATAIINNARVVTADQNLLDCDLVKTVWR